MYNINTTINNINLKKLFQAKIQETNTNFNFIVHTKIYVKSTTVVNLTSEIDHWQTLGQVKQCKSL